MNCRYCNRISGHEEACPESEITTYGSKSQRLALWQLGYLTGRTEELWGECFSEHSSYCLGFTEGTNALEEHENGYRPGVDGGQW